MIANYRIRTGLIARFIVGIADKFNKGVNIVGVTIWPFIFIYPPEYKENERLIKHESKHLQQWLRYWIIGFLPVYIYYNIKYGYWNNPLEISARVAEQK